MGEYKTTDNQITRVCIEVINDKPSITEGWHGRIVRISGDALGRAPFWQDWLPRELPRWWDTKENQGKFSLDRGERGRFVIATLNGSSNDAYFFQHGARKIQ